MRSQRKKRRIVKPSGSTCKGVHCGVDVVSTGIQPSERADDMAGFVSPGSQPCDRGLGVSSRVFGLGEHERGLDIGS